jgi:pimeloyl-ACP methyl ester carboxylesterase
LSVAEVALDTRPVPLAARRWHSGARTRVLALHGWLDNAATFDALAPLLPDCEIVALDLPGHGRSGHRAPGAWYHFIDYGSDVIAAADALGWERFVLLGHSLGGAIASVLAGAVPERIAQLWLIEALGPMSTAPAQGPELLGRALREREGLREKALRVFASVAEAAQARVRANDLSLRAALALSARGTRAVDGGFVWSSDQRLTLTSAIRLTEEQILGYLGAIACPTLLVRAEPAPKWLPPAMMAARIAAVRDITERTLPGSHHLHLEEPAPVAQAISEFRRGPGRR